MTPRYATPENVGAVLGKPPARVVTNSAEDESGEREHSVYEYSEYDDSGE